MNKTSKIAIGVAAGTALGSISSRLSSNVINRTLLKKYELIDLELENSLTPRQLEFKSRIERKSFDLDYHTPGSSSHVLISMELKKLISEFLATLRPNQLILYNKASFVLGEMNSRTKSFNIYFSILGGLAGGIISSKIK